MTIKNNQEFKFNIGDTVSAHKPGFGYVQGIITGRAILTMGTPLYWIRTTSGHELKVPQHQIRGGYNE